MAIVTADGTASSNGQTFQATTKIKAEKLKPAAAGTPTKNPLRINTTFTEDLKQHSGQLTQSDILIGSVKASQPHRDLDRRREVTSSKNRSLGDRRTGFRPHRSPACCRHRTTLQDNPRGGTASTQLAIYYRRNFGRPAVPVGRRRHRHRGNQSRTERFESRKRWCGPDRGQNLAGSLRRQEIKKADAEKSAPARETRITPTARL